MTAETALRVGQAAGAHFLRGDHRHRVVIGKDTRLSGYMMELAMVAGFTSVGMDVVLLGPMPTPAVAMLTRSMRADLGRDDLRHRTIRSPTMASSCSGPTATSSATRPSRRSSSGWRRRRSSPSRTMIGRARRIDDARGRYIQFAKDLSRASAARRAQGRGRLRQRRRLPCRARRAVGAGRRGRSRSASRPTASTSTTAAARPTRSCCRKRWSRAAPTSALRSTATPTG